MTDGISKTERPAILVTGGCGFIGSAFVLKAVLEKGFRVVNLDKLTYAGNPENLAALDGNENYVFVHGDIADEDLVASILRRFDVRYVVNFAAQTHVDRSVFWPESFFETNVTGCVKLLKTALHHWKMQSEEKRNKFRFVQIGTDEIYGSLSIDDPESTEESPIRPSSPYSASKASADMAAKSFWKTYGLPVICTACSNNYGPRQFPEKLIPLMISRAVAGEPLPVYGNGTNMRDWIHVDDHCEALFAVLAKGRVGSTYNIGGSNVRTNLEVIEMICRMVDERLGRRDSSFANLTFVKDRPGHDFRYALDTTRARAELGWQPQVSFEQGMMETVDWYLANQEWLARILNGEYRNWAQKQYGTSK